MQKNRVLPGSTRYQRRGSGKEQKVKTVGGQNRWETLCQSINQHKVKMMQQECGGEEEGRTYDYKVLELINFDI